MLIFCSSLIFALILIFQNIAQKYMTILILGIFCVLRCFSCGRLFVTLWTVTYQAPLSMGFFRQEYWVAIFSCRVSSQLRDQIRVSCSSCIAGGFFTAELPGKPPHPKVKNESESRSMVSDSLWPLGLSRESSQPKDRAQASRIAGRFFTNWATREAQE